MRNVRRRVGGLIVGATLAAGAVLAWQATAAADAPDAGPGHGMQRMADLMDAGNPGMTRMHEQMMKNDGARRAHERMMQDAGMAEMHRGMMGGFDAGS